VIPRQRWEPAPGLDDWTSDYGESSSVRGGAWSIPTVDHVRDAISMMTADTVLQILRGQGITYGLGAAVGSAAYVHPPGRPVGRPRGAMPRRRQTPRAPGAVDAPGLVHVCAPRRTCVWCFQRVAVRADGTLAEHYSADCVGARCGGSGP
jgi:hypothetical protein